MASHFFRYLFWSFNLVIPLLTIFLLIYVVIMLKKTISTLDTIADKLNNN